MVCAIPAAIKPPCHIAYSLSQMRLTQVDREQLQEASVSIRRRHGLDPFGRRLIPPDAPIQPDYGPTHIGYLLPVVLAKYGIVGGD